MRRLNGLYSPQNSYRESHAIEGVHGLSTAAPSGRPDSAREQREEDESGHNHEDD